MSSSLTAARMSYAAAVLGCFTYGIYVVLAGISMYYLLQHRQHTKGQYVLIIYTCAMFTASTIYFCCAAKWSEIEFVESTDQALFATLLSSPIAIAKDTASVVSFWLADSLIIYRTYIVWGGNLWIIIIPCILFMAAVGSSIVLLVETARPGAGFGNPLISKFGTAFWSISVSLNVISTILIAGMLLYHDRKLRRLGFQGNGPYTGIAAVLAESAALYSICGLIYIPLFARNMDLQYPFSPLFISAASIAPTLIVIRMALGVAVKESRETNTNMNIAPVADSGYSRKRESNHIILGSRSHRSNTDSTINSPVQHGFKSVQTLEGDSVDVYHMAQVPYSHPDAV